MLKAHSIGPKGIVYLEQIGIERLKDLAGTDAEEIVLRINITLGWKHLNRLGIQALRNLLELADREAAGCDAENRRHKRQPALKASACCDKR